MKRRSVVELHERWRAEVAASRPCPHEKTVREAGVGTYCARCKVVLQVEIGEAR